MASAAQSPDLGAAQRRLGLAWVLLCLVLAVHVADEALNGFLAIYNPTAEEIGRRVGLRPPVFGFTEWLVGLIAAVVVLLALSPFAFQNRRWWRPLAYFFAAIMFSNGVGHTAGSILGHTFPDIRFPRPMPGFYSSPLLFAGSVWLFVCLRRTAIRPR